MSDQPDNNNTENNALFEDIFSGLVTPFSSSTTDSAFIPMSSLNTFDYPSFDATSSSGLSSSNDYPSMCPTSPPQTYNDPFAQPTMSPAQSLNKTPNVMSPSSTPTQSAKNSAENFFLPTILSPPKEQPINFDDLPNPPNQDDIFPPTEPVLSEEEILRQEEEKRLLEEQKQREEEERIRKEEEYKQQQQELKELEDGSAAALGSWEMSLICNMKWKLTDLSNYHIAISSYGGPIAIIPHEITIGSRLEVYGSNGVLIWSRSCPTESKIINIGWTDSEELCIIPEDGKIVIYTMNIEENIKEILPEDNTEEKVISGFVSGKGVAVLTQNNSIYAIENIEIKDMATSKYPSITSISSNIHLSLLTVLPSYLNKTKRIRPLLTPTTGDDIGTIYMVSYNDIESNNILNIKNNVVCVSQHITGALLAILYQNGQLVMADSDLKSKMIIIDCGFVFETIPITIEWAGNDENCVCGLLIKNQPWNHQDENIYGILYVGLYGGYKRQDFNESPILKCEIDGLRIITTKTNSLYRGHPQTLDIINSENSNEYKLLHIYELIQNKDPNLSEVLKSVKEIPSYDLNQATSNLIKASLDSTEWNQKLACIKAASYGKKIVSSVIPKVINEFVNSCKILKILYNVSHGKCNRTITYNEFTHLSPLVLVSRLTKQGRFLEALSLSKELQLGENFDEAILIDWTREQLDEHDDMEDDELEKLLIKTLSRYEVSYPEIAKIVYSERPEIAHNILQLETDPTKKVLVLLQMERYEEALEIASKTYDTDLIFVVIKKLEEDCDDDDDDLFDRLKNNFVARNTLLKYYSVTDKAKYMKALRTFGKPKQSVMLFYDESFIDEEHLEKKQDLIQMIKMINGIPEYEFEKLICQIYAQCLDLQNQASTKLIGLSLQKTMENLISRNSQDSLAYVEKLKTLGLVSDKRYLIIRIFSYLHYGMVDNLRKLANDFNRTLGFEPFIEACMKCGKRNEALFYINQLKDQNLANSYKQQLGVNQKHPLKEFFKETFGFEINGNNSDYSYRKPENIFGRSDVEMAEKYNNNNNNNNEIEEEEVEESNPFGNDDNDNDNPFGDSSSLSSNKSYLKPPPQSSSFNQKSLSSIGEVETPFSSSNGSVEVNPFGSDDNIVNKKQSIDTSNPFGRESNASEGNPFGRESVASEGNPFGSDSIDEGNPFAKRPSVDTNPFGGGSSGGRDRRSSVGNPFGGSFGDWFD